MYMVYEVISLSVSWMIEALLPWSPLQKTFSYMEYAVENFAF